MTEPIVRSVSVEPLGQMLNEAIEQIGRLGSDFSASHGRLLELQQRLSAGRFHLAVLGQFKRGKSTLLNALLGEPLLPTAVLPVTAIPTFIGSGASPRFRVSYRDGRPSEEYSDTRGEKLSRDLARFVTEAQNPGNCLQVAHVEVFHPAPILQKGVILIDTPGIGSTFRHNTETAFNILPQCDAALFITSAEPPLTELEVFFLREICPKVSRLFFILNKVDSLRAEDRATTVPFLKEALRKHVGITTDPAIFCVSALLGLEAKRSGDTALLAQSGLQEVENHLVDFLAQEKAAVLQEALKKKTQDALTNALMQLSLNVKMLQIPLHEQERKLSVLGRALTDAQRQQVAAKDLLAGDRQRMAAFVESEAERLRQKAKADLQGAIEKTGAGQDPDALPQLFAHTVPSFFEAELGILSKTLETQLADLFRPHQEQSNALVETIRKTAADLFEIPYAPMGSGASFEIQEEPYWVTQERLMDLSPLNEGWADKLLPSSLQQKRARARVARQVDSLVLRNVENLRWALLQGLEKTFSRFEAGIDGQLKEAIQAIRAATQAASAKRQERQEQVTREIDRLRSFVRALQGIQQQLNSL